MGTVIIHAGMPKAGSSSIQHWLRHTLHDLRKRDIQVLQATDKDSDHVRVIPYESGGIMSDQFLYGYLAFDRHRGVLDRLIDGIAGFTGADGTTVITAEAFANLFTHPDDQFSAGLERLAGEHRVRVAYYVRPQHTSLEAAWRQWGFRLGEHPSTYLIRWAGTLDYLATLDHQQAVAPGVSFEVRPFRPDLLVGGDVVSDFASRFLGVEAPPAPTRENEGFSLDVVNVLRTAPQGMLWSSAHDNRVLNRIRTFVNAIEVEPSPEARRSREILAAFAHERYEVANRVLIDRLGWPTDSFVPTPADPGATDLTELDPLWLEPSTATTRSILFGLLADLGHE